jgi:bacterioferritin-associated ferredoxin
MILCNCSGVSESKFCDAYKKEKAAGNTPKFKKLCQDHNVCQQCGICGQSAKKLFDELTRADHKSSGK